MPRPRRRIAIFSSSRADLWPLAPIIDQLHGESAADMYVIAAASHLAKALGMALTEIDLPRSMVEVVESGLDADDPVSLAATVARTSEGVARVLADRRPDVLVVLGDRIELLGTMTAATLHRVPVAHLHGGEVTEGAIDDNVRHAVTKLSHLHLCATHLAASRVLAMGEEPWRVHVTGAPGIDRLTNSATRWSAQDVARAVGLPLNRPFGLLSYHPPTARPEDLDAELEATIEGVAGLRTVVATAPGADAGARRVMERLRSWAGSRQGATVIPSLGELYPSAMAAADVVVGNSSSGIIEAPTLGVPVVNVGSRQDGRERAACIIDAPGVAGAVARAVDRALDPDFRRQAATCTNPYGDGRAAPRIVEILLGQPLDALLVKHLCATSPP